MNTIDIPFSKHTGIKQENENLTLEPFPTVMNYIGTIHASAQFIWFIQKK